MPATQLTWLDADDTRIELVVEFEVEQETDQYGLFGDGISYSVNILSMEPHIEMSPARTRELETTLLHEYLSQ